MRFATGCRRAGKRDHSGFPRAAFRRPPVRRYRGAGFNCVGIGRRRFNRLFEKNLQLGLGSVEMIFEELTQREASQLVARDDRLIAEASPLLTARNRAAACEPVEKCQHGRICQGPVLGNNPPYIFDITLVDLPEGIQADHFQRRGKFAFAGQGYFLSSCSACCSFNPKIELEAGAGFGVGGAGTGERPGNADVSFGAGLREMFGSDLEISGPATGGSPDERAASGVQLSVIIAAGLDSRYLVLRKATRASDEL